MLQKYICVTCGVQYPPSEQPPEFCAICEEERQYVHPEGQKWTTLEEIRRSGKYKNEILKEEEGVYSITTKPGFGIGQTAYLVKNNGFHVLWDCITYLDEYTITSIRELGGIDAIALSHPHYYSTQLEWAETFDASIYIHEDDSQWVMKQEEQIKFWNGEEKKLTEDMSVHRLGGHFKGGAVLHCLPVQKRKGLLFTGDIIQVVEDTDWVSFMYSYPNLIPLPAEKVKEMAERVGGLSFDRIYNAFHKNIPKNADEAVQRSADRYIRALEGTLFKT
ncbi:MBL fold metallo-hydrolase [Alteribacillus sp. HJP-4]|uniref:MBL fold metallo-hydrolase n=1 Tax=Alteribacillus sp. HJP-4 TaxID=2775394 RepID=UPI0035CD3CAC